MVGAPGRKTSLFRLVDAIRAHHPWPTRFPVTTRRPLPRLSIAQMPMHWTCAENLAVILQMLTTAAREGAAICVFPELAVTGFHHQVTAEARPRLMNAALKKIRARCAAERIACAVGAPSFEGRRPFNSHLHIDADGAVSATVSKIGLTPNEAKFFAPGTARPVSTLQGLACTSVICREVEDLDHLAIAKGSTDLIFWPGYVGKLPDDPPDYEGKYLHLAEQLARRSGAWVVQCNWPQALNRPGGANMGESAVIDPRGKLRFKLPSDHAGLATFTLGAKSYAWEPADR